MFTLGFFKIKSMPLFQDGKGCVYFMYTLILKLPFLEKAENEEPAYMFLIIVYFIQNLKMFSSLGNHYSSPLWCGKSLCSNCCYSIGLFPFTLDVQLPWPKALSASSCGRVGRRGEEWSETCGLGKAGCGTQGGPRAMSAPQPPRPLPVIVQGHRNGIKTNYNLKILQ